MHKSRKHSQRRTTLLGAAIGSIIIFTFVITLIVPDRVRRRSSSSADLDSYATPQPTKLVIPTPDPDPQLTGRPPYIHSSGLFETFLPAGDDWIVDEG